MRLSSQRGPARPRHVLVLTLLALLGAASPAAALWREFALASDRRLDDVMLDILEGATLDEQLEILAAIGQREDPEIRAYIDDFLGHHPSRPAQSEHLLRILLDSAFPRDADPDRLAARVEPNRSALLAAAARLATFSDPQLCAVIVRVIPLLPGGRADLLGLVDRLVDRMLRTDGLLDPRENGLLLDALEAMRAIGSPDFLEPVLSVARLSRERVVVERARAVALVLVEAGR
jgi:hypothetical protein